MLEALESLLKDYMQNFKDLGISDQIGHPFDPEHFDFKNPANRRGFYYVWQIEILNFC